MTPDDETNIIAAILARKIDARHVIARVRNLFPADGFFARIFRHHDADQPGLGSGARDRAHATFPAALGVETFGHGRVVMVETEVHEDCPYLGKSLKEIGRQNGHILIAMVEHGEQLFHPARRLCAGGGGQDVCHPGVLLKYESSARRTAIPERHPKTVLIIAGSRVTRYLLPRLSRNKMRAKVIEKMKISRIS